MSAGNHPPLRALLISSAALAIPVTGAFWVPGVLQDYEALLWMLAVVPAFLLAYYKAWRGAAIALAGAMAAVSVTYAITQAIGRPMPDLILAVLIVVIAVSLGAGALAERIYRKEGRGGPSGGFTDPATGLPNRAHADLHLETEFAHGLMGRSVAVVLLNVDNLKGYNEHHGAIAGDEVLRLIGEVLKRTTRRMNLCARYSGDEFLCVLGGSDEDGAIAFVNRFQQMLQGVAGQRPLPAISGGVATMTPGMKQATDLLAAARAALKQAKKDGLGRVRVHGRPLTLPVTFEQRSVPEPASDEAPQDPRSVMPEGRGRGRKALIVAEQPPVRALLARYLNDHGFVVAQVSNVVDGVQSLAVEYDLLFTDIVLQEGIGAELVRAAKLRWPSIQVVGLVQETEGDLLIETLNAGVDRYLMTPLSLSMVRQHLTELLGRRDRLVASVLESRQLSMEFQARTDEAVKALRATEEEYRAILHSVHEVIFRTDLDGTFTFLNDAWEEFTGYSVAASVGKPAGDFVHEEDRGEFTSALRGIAAGDREAARGELRVVTKAGSPRWLELRARRLYSPDNRVTGVSGTLEDVTARKDAEEALRRSEAASRGLLAAFPDQVLLLSRDGNVLSYGGSAHAAEGHHAIDDVFPAPVTREMRSLIDRAFATGEVQVHEYKIGDADHAHQFEVRLSAGEGDEVVAIIRDVTERRMLEEQLLQSQKLEAIGRLAGGLAHDFNNLLTVVQGNAHLLQEEEQDPHKRDYVEQISVAAERGATLVRQLLAFGRRQVMQPTILNLNSLVEGTRSMLARLIGENITLEVDLDPEIGLIKADPGQIEQVLVNLAVNARDVMGATGRLRIATRNGALALHGGDSTQDDVVLLTISDNGPGMDAVTLERVFEPFFTTKGLAHASGLGLATVYGIVRQSGGTVSVSSEPGQGTSFEIALPRIDT